MILYRRARIRPTFRRNANRHLSRRRAATRLLDLPRRNSLSRPITPGTPLARLASRHYRENEDIYEQKYAIKKYIDALRTWCVRSGAITLCMSFKPRAS